MLARLADRLILRPTREEIPCESERRWIDWEGGRFEAWVQRTTDQRDLDLLVLKFPGTGGRAERSTSHPGDCWNDLAAEVWTVNPPGYGGSPGRASLTNKAAVAESALKTVQRAADGRPIVVTGNSLGCVSAMYLAARHSLDGLLLRNPVPLRDVIVTRFGPVSFWVGAALIARQVPNHLCTIQNASRAEAPAVIVSSGSDRIVPPALQQKIISEYRGECRILKLAEADHADLPSESEQEEYERMLLWLREQALGKQAALKR